MKQYVDRMNDLYSEDPRPWGSEPLPVITKFIDQLKPGTVLDLGVGDGRNALYVAKNGFQVTGVDISETGIQKLLSNAEADGLADLVDGVVRDISEFPFDKPFDNIVCNFTLHFLKAASFEIILKKMKDSTVIGGLNIVSDFTQTGPMYLPDTGTRWFLDGELQSLYEGWEILHFEEGETVARQKDEYGNSLIQRRAEIVARRVL